MCDRNKCFAGIVVLVAVAVILLALATYSVDHDPAEHSAYGCPMSISGDVVRFGNGDWLLPLDLTVNSQQKAELRQAMLDGKWVVVVYSGRNKLIDFKVK